MMIYPCRSYQTSLFHWMAKSEKDHSMPASEDLLVALKKKVKEEDESIKRENQELNDLLGKDSWTIHFGKDNVTLNRAHGFEEIKVVVFPHKDPEEYVEDEEEGIDDHDKEEEENEENELDGQKDYFEVFVTKVNKTDRQMKYDIWAVEGNIDLKAIHVLNKNGEVLKSMTYSNMDSIIVDKFFDYLEERTIGKDFCKIVYHALNVYDMTQDKQWMQDIKGFYE